jgi:hypothetical protein
MLPGLNHNIRYRELVLHVQTEDSGQPRATLTTHVFHGGTVVAHEQSSYAANLEAKSADVVRKLMQEQHRRTLKQVTGGHYDAVLRSRGILVDDPLSVLDALPPEIVTVTSAAASPLTSLPAGVTSAPPREGFGPMNLGPAGLGRPSASGGVSAPPSRASGVEAPAVAATSAAPARVQLDDAATLPVVNRPRASSVAEPHVSAAPSAGVVAPRVATARAPSGLPGLAELPLESLSHDLGLASTPGTSADLPSADLARARSRRPATRPASRTGSSTSSITGSLRPAAEPFADAPTDERASAPRDAERTDEHRAARRPLDEAPTPRTSLAEAPVAPAAPVVSSARAEAPPPRTSLAPPPPRAPSTMAHTERDASDQTLLDLPPVRSWRLSRPPLPRPSTPIASDEAIDLSGPVEGVDLASLPPLPPYPSRSAPPLAAAWDEADAETPFRPTPSPVPPSRMPIPDAATLVDGGPPLVSWRPPQAAPSDRVIASAPSRAPARPGPPTPARPDDGAPRSVSPASASPASAPFGRSSTGAPTNGRLPPPPPLTMPRPSARPLVEGLGAPKPGVMPGPAPRVPPRPPEPNRSTSNASAAPRPAPSPPARSPAGPGPSRMTPPSNLAAAPPTPRPGSAAPPASARAPWPPGTPPSPSTTTRRPSPVSSSGIAASPAEPRAPSVARTAEPRAASTQRPADAEGATQRSAPARSASAVRRVEERSLDDIILGYLTKRPPGSGGG